MSVVRVEGWGVKESAEQAERFLVLIETSGNQQYIFSTNRLRENVGASELVRQACTDWVAEATERSEAEVLTTTSGRALVVATTREDALSVIRNVSERALCEAPGLRVTGSFREFLAGDSLAKAFASLSRLNDGAAAASLDVMGRFPRQPLTRPCRSLPFPAEAEVRIANSSIAVSAITNAKLEGSKMARARLHDELGLELPLAQDLGDLEELIRSSADIGWMAVVHADGNGIGQSFIKLQDWVDEWMDRQPTMASPDALSPDELRSQRYLVTYQAMSEALNDASIKALRSAIQAVVDLQGVQREENGAEVSEGIAGTIPVVPLVYGGDDVTVALDARVALVFTETLLKEFQSQSKAVVAVLNKYLEGVSDLPREFTMGAGIALTKPHHPFSSAYQLAEELAESAKSAAKAAPMKSGVVPGSLDFHLHSDSSVLPLDVIRSLRVSRDQRLWGGPYVIIDDPAEASSMRSLDAFKEAISRFPQPGGRERDGGNSTRTGVHRVRESLYVGFDHATRINEELPVPLETELLGTGASEGGAVLGSTLLIDLVDVGDLWVEQRVGATNEDPVLGGGA
jgi:hypothetical protein